MYTKSFVTHKLRIHHLPTVDKIRQNFGGNSVSWSPEDPRFLRVACNVQFVQGYGLTETTACLTSQGRGQAQIRSPLHDRRPRGARGARVIPGYYKDDARGVQREWLVAHRRCLHMAAQPAAQDDRSSQGARQARAGECVSIQRLTTLYTDGHCVTNICPRRDGE
jgi:acyl-CoA synthetase (AMP-forming)/AMP-acid ligase II